VYRQYIYIYNCNPFLGLRTKKRRKNKKNKNIVRRNLKKIGSEKMMPKRLENNLKLVKDVKKIQRLKFNSILLTDESPVDKENSI